MKMSGFEFNFLITFVVCSIGADIQTYVSFSELTEGDYVKLAIAKYVVPFAISLLIAIVATTIKKHLSDKNN